MRYDCAQLLTDYIDMGKRLFKAASEPGKSPHFIAGDLFSDGFLNPEAPQSESLPNLRELTNLTPLIGRVRVLSASSLFHLFSESHQQILAMRLFPLLVHSKPGSMFLGSHVALPEKGFGESRPNTSWRMFCHSPESWRELWEEVGCHYGQKVSVQTQLLETKRPRLWASSQETKPVLAYHLRWSVRITQRIL